MARQSLTHLAKVFESKVSVRAWIGMDVHKDSYHVAVQAEDGRVHTFVGPSRPELVVRMIRESGLKVMQIAYEAGPTGFGLARALQEAGLPVIVVAPSKVPRPVGRNAKSDRLDCIKLAEYSARGMLKPIAIPTAQEEQERSVIRRRHDLVESIRQVKQRIRSLLLFLGAKASPTWSKKGIAALKDADVDEEAKETLESLLRELRFYAEEKRRIQDLLAKILKKPEHREAVESMESVPGIADTTAGAFRLEIFRPERFNDGGEVASYVGLAPVVHQSGLSKPQGCLVPTGQEELRSLLVEAAWRWKARDPEAQAFYCRMLRQTGMFQKAIVALARKLVIILWRLSVEKRPYVVHQVAT